MECFKIEWNGFYSFDEAKGRPEAKGKGVYAIHEMEYGAPRHLHYIGKSRELGGRSKTHAQALRRYVTEPHRENFRLCLGKISPIGGGGVSDKQLEEVESILVTVTKPSGNSPQTKRAYTRRPIIVVNTGETGRIKAVISSHDDFLALLAQGLRPSTW